MSTTADLYLSRSDLWRRHGLLNVLLTLGAPLFGITLVAGYSLARGFDARATLVLLFCAPLAMNREVLRSALANVSRHPYVTLSEFGIRVDGVLKNTIVLPWREIEAMSPEPSSLLERLDAGAFVSITLRVRTSAKDTPRTHSSHQHATLRNHFRISGYFEQPTTDEAAAIATFFESKVEKREPSLITDEPD